MTPSSSRNEPPASQPPPSRALFSTLVRRPVFALACGMAALLSACSSLPSSPAATSGTGISTPGSSRYPQGPLQPLSSNTLRGPGVAELTPPADIWDRMRQGFAMPDLDNELVERNTQYYAERPEYISRMAERSNKYLFHIVEELERRNMPTELALLPFVESAFNPQAVSSAKAAGMWQFIPSTGRHFELTQNAFRDDRRDVLASTRAALDYLNRLYGMFGDWQLALAAYNWGEGSVQRAQTRNERQGLGLKYTDLSMPAETRNYVPKLQALKNIVAHPERYGVTLPDIGNHPYFQTVDIDRDIDVTVAAQLANVSVDDFKSLNPSANKPLIMAAGTPQILLPWDNAITFANSLRTYKGPLASWAVWVAPSTMSTGEAAQRVGMSEEALRTANKIPARMRVREGSTLLVTRTAAMSDVTSKVAESGQIAFAPERPSSIRYTVRRGDSLGAIAARHGVSAASLASWNRLKTSSAVRTWQSLVIYPSGSAPARAATATAARPASQASGKRTARAAQAAPAKRTASQAKAARTSTAAKSGTKAAANTKAANSKATKAVGTKTADTKKKL
ncbi:MAG: Membrane-bound lytic murein transglycosylase D [Paracidovorax wautersii]|uniref:Membrane-bound lytic murein transglycosylase D n=1 Tax=Paracidovorax wautersii TaxID=1177982 RepID=A0A7V8FMX9_9BURK|nr:MAG: Membrane-bound lytic murein transglycosylase D [Paracidovorax wautersii]